MKRSLNAVCLLLCLAAVAAAQEVGANANANANVNANAANANSAKPVTLEVQPGQTAKIVVGTQAEQSKGLDAPLFKDWVDVISKLGTPISIIVAIILAWQQIKKNREERERNEDERKDRRQKDAEEKDKDRAQSERNRQQREDDVAQRKAELRWRKAQLARELLKGLYEDPYATDMMTMLDWNDREFSVKSSRTQPGSVETISWEEMWAALRITELHFNDKEKFIRDCLDAFFGRMQTIEHYRRIKLITLADVAYPFDYYLKTIDYNPIMFDIFIKEYHPRAASFLGRLRDFEARKVAASPPASETASQPPSAPPSSDEAVSLTEQAEVDTGAYFMFDCPPREERFYVRVEDSSDIAGVARKILAGKSKGRLSGAIVSGKEYYNARWEFHVDPASISFVESDPQFAHQMNEAIEAQLREPKKGFPENDIWHTGGARLLAELPPGWFEQERDGRQNEGLAALWGQGRVGDTAAVGGAATGGGGSIPSEI